jgi:hypothetical protein
MRAGAAPAGIAAMLDAFLLLLFRTASASSRSDGLSQTEGYDHKAELHHPAQALLRAVSRLHDQDV